MTKEKEKDDEEEEEADPSTMDMSEGGWRLLKALNQGPLAMMEEPREL